MTGSDRRSFVKSAAAALSAWPSLIQGALAVPAQRAPARSKMSNMASS